jgi:alditol oxidase
MSSPPRNWAGNVVFAAGRVEEPGSVGQLSAVVNAAAKAKAVGSRHSFSGVIDTDGVLVSTEGLSAIELEETSGHVCVGAGVRYGDLLRVLRSEGRTLTNLASLPHITVAGAAATATHGSGAQHQCLASSVVALELVLADGSAISVDRDDLRFNGAVVGLGALGLVSSLTLATVEDFSIAQWVFEDVPWAVAEGSLLQLLDLGYSASFFLSWTGEAVEQFLIKTTERVAPEAPGRPARRMRHPVPGADPRHCTPQLGVLGPAGDRVPHFLQGGVPSAGAELQSEWMVERCRAPDAFGALRPIGPEIAPALFVSEIRTVAADEFWLSPFYGRDSVAFHFTWKPTDAAWPAIARVESVLRDFDARPHWGKLFSPDPALLQDLYPRYDDFRRLRGDLDPTGKFVNPFLIGVGLA